MEDHNSHFVSCLKEIQRSYVSLPKILRLRVEHWVEKLSLTGGNATWRKDRDMYTKMLLNMVLAKKLEAPFDKSPIDGPLPPFPSQYKCKLKEMIGPHETSFWRDVYSNLSDTENINRSQRSVSRSARPAHVAVDESMLARREQDNLLFLNQELDRRVLLLEQQLQEERLKHEIELQRLLNEQRHELMRIKDTTRSLKSPSASMQLDTSVNQSTHFFRDILNSTQEAKSPLKSPKISADVFVRSNSKENVQLNASFSSAAKRSSRLSSAGPGNVSFSSSTKGGSDALRKTVDIHPQKIQNQAYSSPTKFLQEQERINKELTTGDLSHNPESPMDKSKYSVMDAIPSNEDDFLKYLEDFQDEIKNLRYKP